MQVHQFDFLALHVAMIIGFSNQYIECFFVHNSLSSICLHPSPPLSLRTNRLFNLWTPRYGSCCWHGIKYPDIPPCLISAHRTQHVGRQCTWNTQNSATAMCFSKVGRYCHVNPSPCEVTFKEIRCCNFFIKQHADLFYPTLIEYCFSSRCECGRRDRRTRRFV